MRVLSFLAAIMLLWSLRPVGLWQCDPKELGLVLGLGVEVVVLGQETSNLEGSELVGGFGTAVFIDGLLLELFDAF